MMEPEIKESVALINYAPGGKVYAFRYPPEYNMRPGGIVKLEGTLDFGIVLMTHTFYFRNDLQKFCEAVGAAANLPLKKVLAYAEFTKIHYTGEEEENGSI